MNKDVACCRDHVRCVDSGTARLCTKHLVPSYEQLADRTVPVLALWVRWRNLPTHFAWLCNFKTRSSIEERVDNGRATEARQFQVGIVEIAIGDSGAS